jgi:rhodanese-related sulfurtransferase
MSSAMSVAETTYDPNNDEFLLLDLRDPDDYRLQHIKQALNWPAANILRDKLRPEMFNFVRTAD